MGMQMSHFPQAAAIAALSLLTTVLLWSGQAVAEGAVAVGIAPGGAQHGYAVGFALNSKDEAQARTAAINACKKSTGSNPAAQEKCAVVATFHNQCVASALDPQNGTPGAGWGVADTQKQADAIALDRCRKTAGAARRKFCVVEDRHCEGKAAK